MPVLLADVRPEVCREVAVEDRPSGQGGLQERLWPTPSEMDGCEGWNSAQGMQERNALDSIRAKLEFEASKPGHKDLFFFREWYMKEFAPPVGARILDIGGYVGATAKHYMDLGHDVTSIEASHTFCEQFRKNVPTADLRECLLEEFDEPEGYDAASCTEILNMVPDPSAIVEAIHKSLKPGGLVFVTVTERTNRHHMRHYTVTSLREQMRDFDVDVKLWGDGIHEPQIIARGYK